MDLLAVLGNVELFDGITPDELEAVSKICRERSYHAGDVLTSQGEPGDELYVICDGFVEVLRSETPSDPSPGQLSTWTRLDRWRDGSCRPWAPLGYRPDNFGEDCRSGYPTRGLRKAFR